MPIVLEQYPLPVRFILARTLKRGVPKPTMKKANVDEANCMESPYVPDIIDSSMFSETFGIAIAPNAPMDMYKVEEKAEDP